MAGVALYAANRPGRERPGLEASSSSDPRRRSLQDVPREEQVSNVMNLWRSSILARDIEAVGNCDRIFSDQRAVFTPPLVKSARSDADERVRAFSTRMLGKFRDPALVPLFRELIADPSTFVRSNAVWALGELGIKVPAEGRREAAPAAPKARTTVTTSPPGSP
jgi:hypothetical protein